VREICLLKLTGWRRGDDGQRAGASRVRIDEGAALGAPFGLWLDAGNELAARPLAQRGDADCEAARGATLLATLKCVSEDRHPAWYLVPRSHRLGINGTVPPLPLVRVEPGALLSVDGEFWLVCSVWQPKPGPAPPEVADRPCPVCGGKLGEAPVVQCPTPLCGRWTHLERPDDPRSEDALNCYLAADCPNCHHPATLDPLFVPDPHEKLLPTHTDEVTC
jgi:hypothetical protein